MKKRTLLFALPLISIPLAIAMASCGGPEDPAGTGGDYPSGTGGFNPGSGGHGNNSAGYGANGANPGNGGQAGEDGGGDEPTPPPCADEFKRCDHQFTYPAGSETSVELRGDFSADGWEKGIAFQKSGSQWVAVIPVPYNFSFKYKLVIDGTSWIPDPGNPTQVDDGQGGKNSVFQAETCDWWSCANDPAPLACDETARSCAQKFQKAVEAGDTSVEVRGTFKSDGWTNGVPMTKDGNLWEAFVDIPWGVSVEYKFVVNGTQWIADPANPKTTQPDGNSLLENPTCGWWSCGSTQSGYDWRDAVLYFAFVDRFMDGNPANNGGTVPNAEEPAQYKGGDWAGVLQKINDGYFNALGVNTLWLTVPMQNPDVAGLGDDGHMYSAYHGYWPTELDKTETRFGSMAELKAVVDAAHGKDIKVILDYAMNHVHKDSPVYQQHPDWFWPNSWNGGNCVCGEGCSWDDATQAKRCWFRDYLPDFNFTVDAARKFSVDNALWWVGQTGVDGFRLDAVKHIEDQWLIDLRSRVKAEIEPTSGNHFYMVGETYTGDQGTIKKYVNASMLDGQFDFPARAQLAQAVLTRSAPMSQLEGFMNSNDSYYGSQAVMSTFIGNHDLPRMIHLAEDSPAYGGNVWDSGKSNNWNNKPGQPANTSAYERLGNAFTILFTTKGVPLVYYGDEVGMAGAGDPDNRRFMQWSGYNAGQTFLFEHMKKLGTIRAAHPALRKGTRTTLSVSADAWAYKLESGTDTVYVAVNRSDSQQSVSGVPSGNFDDLLSGTAVSGGSVNVPARSARILVAK